ncbi:MAG: Peptidyl-prolyl isomerase cwc27 [Chrysothrix sp. TS-e1954]|nr:MAG: Peptidyl-prolyl isomerase cwc27 [Chrysothrix sp. TS-e1954]
MSTLYNLEPHPTAKCILHTTSGDVLLELFGKQTPLTTRNFLQHCLDGYYNDTVFHRLVPGFILQGGDPTGTGSGGESIYDGGKPFADEFHTRLRFNRRGLLGMANAGEKDDNGSQFFLTLGKTDELNGKHTMFGRVVGDTLYNLVKMGEAEMTEVEGSERPMYPTRIVSVEVLVNPFEDMVARPRVAKRTAEDDRPAIKKRKKKPLGKQMLSFGDPEAEDGEQLVMPLKAVKFNPKLVRAGEHTTQRSSKPTPPPSDAQKAAKVKESSARPATRRKTPSRSPSQPPATSPAIISKPSEPIPVSPTPSPTPSPPPTKSKENLLNDANAQIAALKSSLRRNVPDPNAQATKQKISALKAMIPANSTRGRKRGAGATAAARERDEKQSLRLFEAFGKRLEGSVPSAPPTNGHKPSPGPATNGDSADTNGIQTSKDAPNDDDEAPVCDLHFVPHCQSCSKWDEAEAAENEEDDGVGLMGHQLSFAKDRLGKSLEWKRQNEKELVIIDPREREKDLKEERRKDKGRREKSGR